MHEKWQNQSVVAQNHRSSALSVLRIGWTCAGQEGWCGVGPSGSRRHTQDECDRRFAQRRVNEGRSDRANFWLNLDEPWTISGTPARDIRTPGNENILDAYVGLMPGFIGSENKSV